MLSRAALLAAVLLATSISVRTVRVESTGAELETEEERAPGKDVWPNKAGLIVDFLEKALQQGQLEEQELKQLKAIAEEIASLPKRLKTKTLKNSYLKGPSKDALEVFAREIEKAEYTAKLGAAPSKLAVFDFDQTLSTAHYKPPQTKAADVLPDERKALLEKMFDDLEKNGAKVVVLTRNSAYKVEQALNERITPGKVFMVIGNEVCNNYDWCDYDYNGRASKATALEKLFLGPWNMDWSQVLFADDDPTNCDDVAAKEGATAVRVCNDVEWQERGGRGPECKGLSSEDVSQVVAWAGS